MGEIITIGIGVLFLITLLAIGSPLINKILNDEVIDFMNNTIDNLEYFIGSDNLNIFLILIATIILFTIYRFIHSYFKN